MEPQKPHGGLRFGMQIPPCHEMLVESLCFSYWPGLGGQCSLRVWFLDRGLREDTPQHTAPRGVCGAARSPKVSSINDTKFTVTLGTRANRNAG